jgi:carbon storage regulator
MKGFVMLILSRKIGERVCIGPSVVVTVVAARNGQVRLAFDAPAQVAIDREEVRQRCGQSTPRSRNGPTISSKRRTR